MRHDQFCFHQQKLLADEMQELVRRAASPVRPGEIIKAQMVRAFETLGRPPFWRIRQAWWGRAGHWIATAVDDFRRRDLDRGKNKSGAATDQSKQSAGSAAQLTVSDRERLGRLREGLSRIDEEFYTLEIAALDRVLRAQV